MAMTVAAMFPGEPEHVDTAKLVPRQGVRWVPPPNPKNFKRHRFQGEAEKARRRRQMERAARKQESKT